MTDTAETLLVVDDDIDIVRFIQMNLKIEGFEVLVASDGDEALEIIERHQPALAIVDWMMPKVDGLELIRRVRANPFTSSMPIILLTARGRTTDKVIGLNAGSDDYLVKPFDTMELVARVRSTLRRTQEYREVSPLTGLPGNNRILLEIADRARGGDDYAVCYMDIDRFKSVNDRYGFARGDEFIAALARSLHRAVTTTDGPPAFIGHVGGDDYAVCYMDIDRFKSVNDRYGFARGDEFIAALARSLHRAVTTTEGPPPFIGHVGGDDFVVVCGPEQVRPLTEKTVVDFEQSADALYDPEDAQRGHIVLKSRRGEPQQANLVTLSIGVAFSVAREWSDPREIVAVSSDMKTVAKKFPGSYVAFDRRGAASGTYGLAPDSHLGLQPGEYVGPDGGFRGEPVPPGPGSTFGGGSSATPASGAVPVPRDPAEPLPLDGHGAA